MTNTAQVQQFLKQFKATLSESGLDFVDRDKNLSELAFLGWFQYEAEQVILGLTVEDYVEGPLPDRAGIEGDIWVFSVAVDSRNLYIKLKYNGIDAKCMSFHILERPVRFPFRGGS